MVYCNTLCGWYTTATHFDLLQHSKRMMCRRNTLGDLLQHTRWYTATQHVDYHLVLHCLLTNQEAETSFPLKTLSHSVAIVGMVWQESETGFSPEISIALRCICCSVLQCVAVCCSVLRSAEFVWPDMTWGWSGSALKWFLFFLSNRKKLSSNCWKWKGRKEEGWKGCGERRAWDKRVKRGERGGVGEGGAG